MLNKLEPPVVESKREENTENGLTVVAERPLGSTAGGRYQSLHTTLANISIDFKSSARRGRPDNVEKSSSKGSLSNQCLVGSKVVPIFFLDRSYLVIRDISAS